MAAKTIIKQSVARSKATEEIADQQKAYPFLEELLVIRDGNKKTSSNDSKRLVTEALITGRTRMNENVRCIGGLDLINKVSFRLLNPDGTNYNIVHDPEFQKAPFEVGKVFRIEYAPATKIIPPHTEDIRVFFAKELRDEPDVRAVIERTGVRVYSGVNIRELFDGKLKFNRNKAYISAEDPSSFSTCFWVAGDRILPHEEYGKTRMLCDGLSVGYVGEAPARELPAGTLIRFSLSREYKPDTAPAGCYLQLSGWF